MTLEEVTDLAGDRVLAVLQIAIVGASSGATGNASFFSVLTLRDGLIAENVEYLNRAEALKEVGLTE